MGASEAGVDTGVGVAVIVIAAVGVVVANDGKEGGGGVVGVDSPSQAVRTAIITTTRGKRRLFIGTHVWNIGSATATPQETRAGPSLPRPPLKGRGVIWSL